MCYPAQVWSDFQGIALTATDYPEPDEFTDQFHPRFHPYGDHVRYGLTATPDYRYVVYVGVTRQGRRLVDEVLRDAALEMTRESNDPIIKEAAAKMRHAASTHGQKAREALERFERFERFEQAIRDAGEAGAA